MISCLMFVVLANIWYANKGIWLGHFYMVSAILTFFYLLAKGLI
jgi:hypothetical protein